MRHAQRHGKEVLHKYFLHTVFLGNPGTGKSTVARILAKIYKALGILERGHMVETDRQGLVAGYIGQSAIKTAERIDEAMGGVLFIDEAYSLTQSMHGQGDYGSEVIQTLLKRMEDQRGLFFVFVAGYTDQMEQFLKSNPGLSSRFDKILKFEDYGADELYLISLKMITDAGLDIQEDAKEVVMEYFRYLVDTKDKHFGNGRLIRSIIQEVIQNYELRQTESTDPEPDKYIRQMDVQHLGPGHDRREIFARPRLNFKKNA